MILVGTNCIGVQTRVLSITEAPNRPGSWDSPTVGIGFAPVRVDGSMWVDVGRFRVGVLELFLGLTRQSD